MTDRGSQPAIVRSAKTNSLSRRMTKMQSISQRVQLDTVLGLTVTSNAGLAFHPTTGIVAYTAGCSVVLLDPVADTQQHLIVPNKRTLSAVTFNSDGRYLASGECGQTPCLRIWDTKESTQICELTGHKNGITLAAFSPDSKFLISVGTHHDNLVIVWDWRNNRKAATNKVTWEVKGIAFSEDGSFFVTVGNRHVKYWYLELEKNARADIVPLIGRSAVLGDYKDECFLDVVCGKGICAEYTYAVTQSGHVCQFNSRRSLEKLTPLKSSAGTCLSAGETGIVVGCADGLVRVFDPTMLTLTGTLPLPHHLGIDVARFTKAGQLSRKSTEGSTHPDCVAIAFDELHDHVIVIFNDHSIYVWDIHDPDRTTKLCSHLYHSRCVWGVDVYAPTHLRKPKPLLPLGSFLSCSSDDTVRMWNINAARMTAADSTQNLFCSYTQKILYNDPTLQYVCNKEINPGGVDPLDVHADSKYGIRCVRIDPYGEQIACGDRMGHIHIYELGSMKETYKIEAHDSEVLCLEYSKPDSGYELLASASRDRLIQVFDVKNDYDCLQTLDDHSSSITALRFATLNGARQFGLISCGVDKAVILRTIQYSAEGGPKLILNDQILSKGGIVYDMDIDPTSQSIITANQDRQLRIYSIKSRKLEKTMKGSASDEGALIKLDLHDSGRFIATSCSDKNLAIIDVVGGDCWAAFSGHSEIVTGLKFNKEESTLISVSGDGCIFVWRVAADQNISSPKTPLADFDRTTMPLSPMNSVASFSEMSLNGSDVLDEELQDILQSNGVTLENSLPGWAKNAEGKMLNSPNQDQSLPRARGRWADEMDHVFLQDDLVGESADSEVISASPKPLSPFANDRALASPLRSERSFASSSSGSLRSERQKKAQSMFIPFDQEPAPPPVNGNNTKRSGRLSASCEDGEENRRAAKGQATQPSIMGFLSGPRKTARDELDDEDLPRRPVASPLVFKGPNDVIGGSHDDSESNSNASMASPIQSRPHTPSDVANKFLNLNASGIDKILKSRLPHRQSGTLKHQLAGPLTPVMADSVGSPPTPEVVAAPKPAPPISPSKKLIQNAKLSANRQKFKSTQNLSTPLQSMPVGDERSSQDTEPAQDIRRATSMTSLEGGDFKERNGLDGYNSLLERAKARLAASQTKSKTNEISGPPPVVPQRSRLTSLDGSSGVFADRSEVSNVSDNTGSRESRDRRPIGSRVSLGTLRNRSSERKALSSPVTKEPEPLEDASTVATIKQKLERRARENSASRNNGVGSQDESPTAKAIARIKAGIGLTDKPLDVNGDTAGISLEQCRQQCTDLSYATQSIVDSIKSVLDGSSSDPKAAQLIITYCNSLSEAKMKFEDLAKLIQNWDLVSKAAHSNGMDESDRAVMLNLQGLVKKLSD